jgi:hypothetical protein
MRALIPNYSKLRYFYLMNVPPAKRFASDNFPSNVIIVNMEKQHIHHGHLSHRGYHWLIDPKSLRETPPSIYMNEVAVTFVFSCYSFLADTVAFAPTLLIYRDALLDGHIFSRRGYHGLIDPKSLRETPPLFIWVRLRCYFYFLSLLFSGRHSRFMPFLLPVDEYGKGESERNTLLNF